MKRILSLILALLFFSSISATAFADVLPTANSINEEITFHESDRPNRQEETEWCFRTYHGMRQMRLWSITYERWLTDWIDIGPA